MFLICSRWFDKGRTRAKHVIMSYPESLKSWPVRSVLSVTCLRHRSTWAILVLGLVNLGAQFALAALVLLMDIGATRAEDVNFDRYRHAANFCRGDVIRPMALSASSDILCFDGYVSAMQDLSLAR